MSTKIKDTGNIDSNIMMNAAKSLNWNVVPVPRALDNCKFNNNCGFGCNSKVSLDKLYMKFKDIKIRTNSNVSKIIMDRNKAVGVILSNGEKIFADKGVIVAAGALHSHSILKSSKIKSKAYPQFHINLKFVVEYNSQINASKGTMFTHQIQEFMDKGMLLMPTNFSRKSLLTSLLHLDNCDRKYLYSSIIGVSTEKYPSN